MLRALWQNANGFTAIEYGLVIALTLALAGQVVSRFYAG